MHLKQTGLSFVVKTLGPYLAQYKIWTVNGLDLSH